MSDALFIVNLMKLSLPFVVVITHLRCRISRKSWTREGRDHGQRGEYWKFSWRQITGKAPSWTNVIGLSKDGGDCQVCWSACQSRVEKIAQSFDPSQMTLEYWLLLSDIGAHFSEHETCTGILSTIDWRTRDTHPASICDVRSIGSFTDIKVVGRQM